MMFRCVLQKINFLWLFPRLLFPMFISVFITATYFVNWKTICKHGGGEAKSYAARKSLLFHSFNQLVVECMAFKLLCAFLMNLKSLEIRVESLNKLFLCYRVSIRHFLMNIVVLLNIHHLMKTSKLTFTICNRQSRKV